MTQQFVVQIDMHHDIGRPDKAMARAIARALEYAMENDIAGAEVLNRQDCGQLSVLVLQKVEAK